MLMNQIVHQYYEHGDTGHLIATAQRTGAVTDDSLGALEALRLLARLGDEDAAAFCESSAADSALVSRSH
jgi:hypothetical protein